MQNFTEPEVIILQKQRAVLKKVLEDPNFVQLEIALRMAIRISLEKTAEVLI